MNHASSVRGIAVLTLVAAGATVTAPRSALADERAEGARPTLPVEPEEKRPAKVDETCMPSWSIIQRGVGVIRYNPLGLQYEHRLQWRTRLSDSDSILFKDTYFGAGPQMMVSPSLQRVGFRVVAKPIALLELFALAEYLYFLGNFQYVQSFDDASADFSQSKLQTNANNGENYSASGLSLAVSARLQAKVGPIAVRSTTRMNRYIMDTKEQHPVWYDIYWDQLSPRNGWTMLQDNDLLYVSGRLIVGLRHTWTRSWLPDEAMAPVADGAPPPDRTHRVGPLLGYRLNDDPKFKRDITRVPTLLLLSQWWVAHPYRTGADTSQAIPWILLVFTYDGHIAGE